MLQMVCLNVFYYDVIVSYIVSLLWSNCKLQIVCLKVFIMS